MSNTNSTAARICQPKKARSCVRRIDQAEMRAAISSYLNQEPGEQEKAGTANSAEAKAASYRPESLCFGHWSNQYPGCRRCEDQIECRMAEEAEQLRRASLTMEERVLTEYAPDVADRMGFQRLALTPEQRGELLDAVKVYEDRRPLLAEYCTPLNAPWIFAAIDDVIHELEKNWRFSTGDPFTLYPFIMSQHFGYTELATPLTFAAVLRSRINSIFDVLPDVFHALQFATYFTLDASTGENRMGGIKAAAMRQAAALKENLPAGEAIE